MYRICLFPGTFDPVTLGHVDIINRAIPLFDKIIVGIGLNAAKAPMFTPEQRMTWINDLYKDEERVEGAIYQGLTVDFCKDVGASYILRGLRTSADFEFERAIAQMNHAMENQIETVFLLSEPSLSHISSTIVRDILFHKGNASLFVPEVLKGIL